MAESGSAPPLVTDVDGTLTDDELRLDPRMGTALREWDGPVVLATGKVLPFPIALANYLGIERTVIAENGGVTFVDATDELGVHGDREAAQAVADAYVDAGYDLGWGPADLPNRWRETEVIAARDQPLEPLRDLAAEHGLEVVDTQYAYHVKSPSMTKGKGLETVADALGYEPTEFVAVGDSTNDVSTFEAAGTAIAVANADDAALAAADHVTDAEFADGFLEALDRVDAGEW
ncbi:SPP-like hydrolase [Halorhabdus utahensis DSM 12940]|uniref:Phosphoglycolate phosphatase n=1 Tax=Halorhabdus utahensis (strain DSM 12940 / JCM 11049 / AX-2) TaxID=519442 RepID=C7NML9_HALUD|nr:phosphoglycolate phosphatase [Halorhabdus utahensis]ACV11332.1 SPP-like hydrolase [Halorhabdus utahensis DSM 12940]